MPRLRVLESPYTIEVQDCSPCLKKLWYELENILESIEVGPAIAERSKSFKKAIELASSTKFRWEKFSIFSSEDEPNSKAIFQLDGRAVCDKACGQVHVMNLVLCFNNREAIGTNFLKLEVAALESIKRYREVNASKENFLGVLVQLTDGLKSMGKWDASYATSIEYSDAFGKAYKPLLTSNIVGLQLHLT